MSTTSTLKIGYHLIDSPFKYNLTYFNDSLKYQALNVLLNVSMFVAPCHIGRPHLCNLIWNSCFFFIDYGEGECYSQLHLSHDSQEYSFVDSCASFFGSLWCHEHVSCTCPFVVL